MHPKSTALTIGETVMKESDDIVIFGVTFHSNMTFEKHLRSVLRGSLTFKLAVLVISIVIDCDRGHCYEHLKKKSNSNEN